MVSSLFPFVSECVNQSVYVVWCSCFRSLTRIYTRHSVFCIDPPTFVKFTCQPLSLRESTHPPWFPLSPTGHPWIKHRLISLVALSWRKRKESVWPCHSSTVLQTSASFTDQKKKKNLGGKNPIFKKPSIFPQPKPMCVWCCILLKSDLGKRALLTNRDVLPSPRLVCFVSVEIKSIYWGYTQQCFPLCFICKSGELPSLRLQIINIPYWILDEFDMANLSNLDIVFHPFMTVPWVPRHPPPFFFYFKMKLSTILVL